MTGRREAYVAGMQAVAPMLPGVVPFGMTAGVAGLDAGLGGELAFAMSVVIFAGASQIAAAQLLGADAAPALVVLTALLINLRMVMYSASLAGHFAPLPLRWRVPMAYLLTDQAYALTIQRLLRRHPGQEAHWFYLGAGLTLWVTWLCATGAGIAAGSAVPPAWELGFIVPLIFLSLLVPAIGSRPGLVAAVTAGVLSVLGRGLPAGLGLTLAALAGIAAGVVTERMTRRG